MSPTTSEAATPTRSGETTPTACALSPSPSSDSLKKEKFDEIIISTSPSSATASEEGLESVDGGWEAYTETELPEKGHRKLFRNLRFQILNVYRRLFSLVFLINIAVLIWVAICRPEADYIGKIVIANVFTAVVIREEHVVNLLFYIFTAVPRSWPLCTRVFTARVYSLGGIHSGSAVAASLWMIYFVIQVTLDLKAHAASIPLVVVSYVILFIILVIIALAMPAWRRVHHDQFEMVHRFLGWTVTALVWAQAILLVRDYKPTDVSLDRALLTSAPLWLVAIMTASIISSWTHLRKVKVQSEVLSSHAVRVHYDYSSAIPGTFSRVSYSPLKEWHSFATIAIPGQKGFDHIISRVGDWTSKTIAEPPSEIWVRGIPTAGIMNVVPLFNRVVVVATGSGIAPCAPHVFAMKTEIKLLWTSRNIRKTYGDRFVDSILEAAPDAIIYDTDAHGKPDMVKLVHHVYKEFNAEAVCIISNQPLTQKVVYGLMARGVPAFGAIWDS